MTNLTQGVSLLVAGILGVLVGLFGGAFGLSSEGDPDPALVNAVSTRDLGYNRITDAEEIREVLSKGLSSVDSYPFSCGAKFSNPPAGAIGTMGGRIDTNSFSAEIKDITDEGLIVLDALTMTDVHPRYPANTKLVDTIFRSPLVLERYGDDNYRYLLGNEGAGIGLVVETPQPRKESR